MHWRAILMHYNDFESQYQRTKYKKKKKHSKQNITCTLLFTSTHRFNTPESNFEEDIIMINHIFKYLKGKETRMLA